MSIQYAEWECLECGYLFEGRQPPRRCPDCRAVGAWQEVEYVDDLDDDSEDEIDEAEVSAFDSAWA